MLRYMRVFVCKHVQLLHRLFDSSCIVNLVHIHWPAQAGTKS